MKKVLLILFIAVIPVLSQNVTVVEDIALTSQNEGSFYYPALNPDGTGILYSSENHKGLWYKNLSSGNTVMITDALGAGYDPGFSSKGNEIIYRENRFVKGKKFSSVVSYDLVTKKSVVLDEGIRDLIIGKNSNRRCDNYIKENNLRSVQKTLQKINSSVPLVFIENSKIVLYENNQKRILEPLGKGNYIWPSISPDKTKLLFTYAGKGTFISDMKGKILAEFGHADYPSWSPDGNWIVFMKDFDDGTKLTSSDIIIADSKGSKFFNLTEKRDNISLYPKWGNSTSEIFYNTDNGQIRKIKLKYE